MGKQIKSSGSSSVLTKPRVRRKGIHAKSKASRGKKSKNYLKRYRGQGK
jgi:hypothetical protein